MEVMVKRVLSVSLLIAMFLLGACSTTIVDAEQTWPLKIWKQNENGGYSTLNVVDHDTGVNYIVVSLMSNGHYGGIAITPRLNADGTLYTAP